MNKSRAMTAVAVIALLLIGVAAGVVGERMRQMHSRVGDDHLARIQKDPMSVFEEHFDLTDQQRERIEAIIAGSQSRIDSAWHAQRSGVQATVDSMVSEIADVLGPEDGKKFIKVANELHGRHGLAPHRMPR